MPTDTSSSVSNQQSTSNSSQAPPAYSQSAAHNITQNELQKRQEELERKAAELAAKEEALRNLEGTVKPPNWPPVPSFCPFGPCFYQDINVEIAPEFQKIVRYAYYLWMCKSAVCVRVSKPSKSSGFGQFITQFITLFSSSHVSFAGSSLHTSSVHQYARKYGSGDQRRRPCDRPSVIDRLNYHLHSGCLLMLVQTAV